jgi:hypothetical protein
LSESGGLRAAVRDRQSDQDVVGRCLGVLGDHVPVTVAIEDSGVGKLVLGFAPAATVALLA